MLDDPASSVRDLPGLRAYDRREIEAFLFAAEQREAELRLELSAARARRSLAEQRAYLTPTFDGPDLAATLDASRAALEEGQAEHDAMLASLSGAADDAARQILRDAERDAVAVRRSLHDLLDQLEADRAPAPAPHPSPVAEVAYEPVRHPRFAEQPDGEDDAAPEVAPESRPVEARAVRTRALSGWALEPTRGLPPWLRLPTAPMVAARS